MISFLSIIVLIEKVKVRSGKFKDLFGMFKKIENHSLHWFVIC